LTEASPLGRTGSTWFARIIQTALIIQSPEEDVQRLFFLITINNVDRDSILKNNSITLFINGLLTAPVASQ
jgi:hypothetical protein